MKLILASASPRRAELLAQAGYEFDIEPADVNEREISAASPSEYVQRLAVAKAQAIAERFPDDVVLAADTVVCLGEEILGKPIDAEHARRMLELLSGTTQIVITGVCVVRRAIELQITQRVMSAVQMDVLSAGQIQAYLKSGEWQGKAGSYGIQDDDPFVRRVNGSHSNIVGLPMETVEPMLARAGIVGKKSV